MIFKIEFFYMLAKHLSEKNTMVFKIEFFT
jgi:hypothetical protein